MYDAILVPTDGSDPAEAAAEGAIALARRFDATLHVVHVLERGDVQLDVEGYDDELHRRGGEITERIAERARGDGVEATTAVVDTTEPVHRAVADYADGHDVDLIAMGTHGRTGLDRLRLGSVAARTLRVAPVPVLTLHEDAPLDPEFDAVLVPTDGSAGADAAGDHAASLAAAVGAALHTVHVVDPTGLGGEYDAAAVLEALEAAGQRAVDDVVERAETAGIGSVEASVLSGTPARAIVDYAQDREVDLIVMGTHGRTGLGRYLLGSVTERVVRLADVPVLGVKDAEEDVS